MFFFRLDVDVITILLLSPKIIDRENAYQLVNFLRMWLKCVSFSNNICMAMTRHHLHHSHTTTRLTYLRLTSSRRTPPAIRRKKFPSPIILFSLLVEIFSCSGQILFSDLLLSHSGSWTNLAPSEIFLTLFNGSFPHCSCSRSRTRRWSIIFTDSSLLSSVTVSGEISESSILSFSKRAILSLWSCWAWTHLLTLQS